MCFSGKARKRPVEDPNGIAQALKDGLVFDYIQRIELHTGKSDRPWGQFALDMDLAHIAWAMDLVRQSSSGRQMCLVIVECVVTNIAKVQNEELTKAAAEFKYMGGSLKLSLKHRDAATTVGDVSVREPKAPVADVQIPEIVWGMARHTQPFSNRSRQGSA